VTLACRRGESVQPFNLLSAELDAVGGGVLLDAGLGLAYTLESMVIDELRGGQLQRVLDPFSPTVPGYCLYFPRRTQRSTPLRLFVDTAKELRGGN
jgi:DNA-binding transcriptional LysR family regulator